MRLLRPFNRSLARRAAQHARRRTLSRALAGLLTWLTAPTFARADALTMSGRRERMLREIEADFRATAGSTGVTAPSESLLRALGTVPRERFIPPSLVDSAYENRPLPIGEGQTISQPYIVALMTELLALAPGTRVLEVGTGSGYQAAVLAELGARVYSIEIVASLAARARAALDAAGYQAVRTRVGDGYRGWPDAAPFDAIVVTAAPDHVPPALLEQLAPKGRLVIPVGPTQFGQDLLLIRKSADGRAVEQKVLPVRFVPLTRER